MRFCSLFSGSGGNCQHIGAGSTNILIDAGLSGKKIQNEMGKVALFPEQIQGILVTHEHIDHVQGVGVLSRRFNIPVFASEKTWVAMERYIGKIKPENQKILVVDKELVIGDLHVTPFNISHDAVEPFGFNVTDGKRKISLLTDTGCINDTIKNKVTGFDLLLLESNHDEELLKVGSYPWSLKRRILSDHGHLSNDMAAHFLLDVLKKGNEKVLLGHLSQENNFPELAYKTVVNTLKSHKLTVDEDVFVQMTFRDKCTRIMEV